MRLKWGVGRIRKRDKALVFLAKRTANRKAQFDIELKLAKKCRCSSNKCYNIQCCQIVQTLEKVFTKSKSGWPMAAKSAKSAEKSLCRKCCKWNAHTSQTKVWVWWRYAAFAMSLALHLWVNESARDGCLSAPALIVPPLWIVLQSVRWARLNQLQEPVV